MNIETFKVSGVARILVAAAVLMVLAFAAGCGKDAAAEAGDSDANGYFCRACQAKFYTERAVFAARCPSCQSTDLAPVVGFLCDKDRRTTIVPRAGDSAKCEQCDARLENIRLPHENELRAWGAAKKNKADVM
jgi:hypothetical protein